MVVERIALGAAVAFLVLSLAGGYGLHWRWTGFDRNGTVWDWHALHGCPGIGSCAAMYTYNTMQSFLAVLGVEPLHMVAPASEDVRRLKEFPGQLVDALVIMTDRGITPRRIVTPSALRNAMTVAIALGGSTNVILHSVEIARAAGLDLWDEVMTQQDFNVLSRRLPVLVDAKPFGRYYMVDIEARGGLPVVVKELLDHGLLEGSCLTCTGETLGEQVSRIGPPVPDHDVVYSIAQPFKATGGLRLLQGNLAPDGGAVLKVAGVERGLQDGLFRGRARVFNSEAALLGALEQTPNAFIDRDIAVVRYEGPRGAPGMPEMLDPTSRTTTLCRQHDLTIGLMTDGRFSGGSIGLVIGHVAPEAYTGGPIALIHDGDTVVVDLNTDRLDCIELADAREFERRSKEWKRVTAANGGTHPHARPVDQRLLRRMRSTARTALLGAGMDSVPT